MSSISAAHCPQIGACADDTLQLDALFPVRRCRSTRGVTGYAVYSWNCHSRAWQPAGVWRATEAQARADRDELLATLDQEAA